MVGANIESMMDLEDAGFDLEGDTYIFWKKMAPDKFSIVIHVTSRERAEEAVRSRMDGTDEELRGITYVVSKKPFAWTFLNDVFVFSKDKDTVLEVINTHLKEKPSILHDEKYMNSVESLRTGDVGAYVALDTIATTLLPMLKLQAEQAKSKLKEQIKQQSSQTPAPNIIMDPSKMLSAEIDMGLWLLEQFKSYAISLEIGQTGVWIDQSLKFKPDSPVCEFLDIPQGKLGLIKYLPSNVMMAGGVTIDAESIQKLNSVMMEIFLPIMQEKMTSEQLADLQKRYETVTRDILSCFGKEAAFAIMAEADNAMPRVVYILEVVNKAKAQKTIGNLEYIMEMSRPFYEAYGADIQMTTGPTQRYTGIQIESFQMDLGKMMQPIPGGASMYPEKQFLWYAFVGDKMVYAMSQSADTMKAAIDAIKGRRAGIPNSPGFEDINIRLPERSNAVVYVSPAGYLGFIMSVMMNQMGRSVPPGTMADNMNMGFATAVGLDGDGIGCFSYFLTKEIQELVSTITGFSQMMARPQR
jgi:hypothetical protein